MPAPGVCQAVCDNPLPLLRQDCPKQHGFLPGDSAASGEYSLIVGRDGSILLRPSRYWRNTEPAERNVDAACGNRSHVSGRNQQLADSLIFEDEAGRGKQMPPRVLELIRYSPG